MPLAPLKSPEQLLDLYYHDLRSHLLEVAAGFDRIERAGASADPRLERLRRIAALAVDGQPERARRLLEELSVR
ncbi:MAG: hypothetical protein RBU25_19325 [Lentisphaeria bacterium]|jgi:hypothetical protein|nr:hypothetical protein [Lentisphaeria bacterium]